MYIPQLCSRRAQRNPPKYNHHPSVGMIYPLSTYIIHQDIFPQIVGMIYPIPTKASNCVKCPKLFDFISIRISKCISPSPRPKGAQKLSNLHSSPKSWHDISNTNICLQLSKMSKTVSCEYSLLKFIFKNIHIPTQRRRAHRN